MQRGEIGDVRLITGGYLQDWLLLDTDWNWRLDPRRGRLAARGRRHRLALDRPRPVHHRPARRGRDGRPHDVHPRAQAADRPGGDVQRREPPARRSTRRWRPRTPPASCCGSSGGARAVVTISQVSAGRKNRLSWEIDGSEAALAWHSEAPEELWLGHRDRPNELLLRERRRLPARPRRGLPRHVQAALPRGLRARWRPAGRPTSPTTRRSPTATRRPDRRRHRALARRAAVGDRRPRAPGGAE